MATLLVVSETLSGCYCGSQTAAALLDISKALNVATWAVEAAYKGFHIPERVGEYPLIRPASFSKPAPSSQPSPSA